MMATAELCCRLCNNRSSPWREIQSTSSLLHWWIGHSWSNIKADKSMKNSCHSRHLSLNWSWPWWINIEAIKLRKYRLTLRRIARRVVWNTHDKVLVMTSRNEVAKLLITEIWQQMVKKLIATSRNEKAKLLITRIWQQIIKTLIVTSLSEKPNCACAESVISKKSWFFTAYMLSNSAQRTVSNSQCYLIKSLKEHLTSRSTNCLKIFKVKMLLKHFFHWTFLIIRSSPLSSSQSSSSSSSFSTLS